MKKKWLLPVVLAGVLVLVTGIVLLSGKSIEFPYGIRPDMSLNEMRVKMEDAGISYDFTREYSDRTVFFFKESYVNGWRSDFSAIGYERKSGNLGLSFYFEESKEYGRQNTSSIYTSLKNDLMKTYGKPSWDMNGLCRWERGRYSLCLSYTDNDGGNLSLSYLYEP